MNRNRSSLPPLALLFAAALLGLRPGGAAAQQPGELERARAQLPPAAAARFDAVVERARARGLPVAPLVDKALEGGAKGVPGDLIVAVLERLAGRLDQARGLLGSTATPTDIAAVAVSLDRGVPDDAVRMLARGRRAESSVAQSVVTLGDLIQAGVPKDVAQDVMRAWMDRGASAGELRELPAAIERLIREGVLPAQAAAAVAQGMRNGRGPASVPGARGKAEGRGHGKPDRPPVAPGSGPPPGKGKPPKGKPPGHGPG